MDYNNKLKLAKEALDSGSYDKETIEYIFPELAESEDEKIRKGIIMCVKGNMPDNDSRKNYIAWLEKQGECPNKVLVSKELYEHIRNTCACIDDAMSSETLVDVRDYLEQADKSAKNAFEMIDKQGEQKPVEWSEEDKALIYNIEQDYKDKLNNNPPESLRPYYNKVISWLKALRPQKQWKPSDEQMEALEHFVRSVGESGYAFPYDNNTKLLYSLLSDLKKLREE